MAIDPDAFDQFLETVARFVRERLIPYEVSRLFGLAIPEAYGSSSSHAT